MKVYVYEEEPAEWDDRKCRPHGGLMTVYNDHGSVIIKTDVDGLEFELKQLGQPTVEYINDLADMIEKEPPVS